MKPLKSLRTTDSANPGWLRRLVRPRPVKHRTHFSLLGSDKIEIPCSPKAQQKLTRADCLTRWKCFRSWFRQSPPRSISRMLVLLLDPETFQSWPWPPLNSPSTFLRNLALRWLVFCQPGAKVLLTMRFARKNHAGSVIVLKKPYGVIKWPNEKS